MITNSSKTSNIHIFNEINEISPDFITSEALEEVFNYLGGSSKRPEKVLLDYTFDHHLSATEVEKCTGLVFNEVFANGGERRVYLGLLKRQSAFEVIAAKEVNRAYVDWITSVKTKPGADDFIAFPYALLSKDKDNYLSIEPFYKHKDLLEYLINLRKLGKKLPIEEVLDFGNKLLGIAHFIIHNKIEHNDFCLENVLVSKNLELRLTDPLFLNRENPRRPSASRLSPGGADIFFCSYATVADAWEFWTMCHNEEVLWHLASSLYTVLTLETPPFRGETVELDAADGFTENDWIQTELRVGSAHAQTKQEQIDQFIDKRYSRFTDQEREAFGPLWKAIKDGLKVHILERRPGEMAFNQQASRSISASPYPEVGQLSPLVIDVASQDSMSELSRASPDN